MELNALIVLSWLLLLLFTLAARQCVVCWWDVYIWRNTATA